MEQGDRITVLYLEAQDESITVQKVPAELVSASAWRRALLVLCSGRDSRGRGTRRMQCKPPVRIVVGGTKIKRRHIHRRLCVPGGAWRLRRSAA